jgi:hypothetical protein
MNCVQYNTLGISYGIDTALVRVIDIVLGEPSRCCSGLLTSSGKRSVGIPSEAYQLVPTFLSTLVSSLVINSFIFAGPFPCSSCFRPKILGEMFLVGILPLQSNEYVLLTGHMLAVSVLRKQIGRAASALMRRIALTHLKAVIRLQTLLNCRSPRPACVFLA